MAVAGLEVARPGAHATAFTVVPVVLTFGVLLPVPVHVATLEVTVHPAGVPSVVAQMISPVGEPVVAPVRVSLAASLMSVPAAPGTATMSSS